MLTEVTASKLTCLIGNWCCIVGVLHWLQLRRFTVSWNTRSALGALEYKIRKESKLHIVYHLHVAGELTGRRQITWEPEPWRLVDVGTRNFSLVKSCYPSIVSRPSSPTDFVPFPPGTWGRFDMSALAGFGGSEDQTIWIDDINCQGTTTFWDGCVGTKLSNEKKGTWLCCRKKSGIKAQTQLFED